MKNNDSYSIWEKQKAIEYKDLRHSKISAKKFLGAKDTKSIYQMLENRDKIFEMNMNQAKNRKNVFYKWEECIYTE